MPRSSSSIESVTAAFSTPFPVFSLTFDHYRTPLLLTSLSTDRCLTRSQSKLERRRLKTNLSRGVIRLTLSSSSQSQSSSSTAHAKFQGSVLTAPQDGLHYATADPLNGAEADDGLGFLAKRRRSNLKALDPVVIVPGFGSSWRDYEGLATRLRGVLPFGTEVVIAPVGLSEWVSCLGGLPATKVLSVIDRSVQSVMTTTNCSSVTLVGHSAGGWISRVYIGDETPYFGKIWNGRQYVKQLICLGTPHDSGEPVTRANMSFVNTHYPGAFYDDVRYVNFAGDAAVFTLTDVKPWNLWDPLWMPRFSYKMTDPTLPDDKAVVGDGIVPLSKTFLQGALNVRLRGVWHSDDARGPWYGDDAVVDYWSRFVK